MSYYIYFFLYISQYVYIYIYLSIYLYIQRERVIPVSLMFLPCSDG